MVPGPAGTPPAETGSPQGQAPAKGAFEELVSSGAGAWDYPVSPKGAVSDDYHGTQVADPYRWLEDPSSAQTRAWIASQNALTGSFLRGLPGQDSLRDRLTELLSVERYSVPIVRSGRHFYSYNSGSQEQSQVFVSEGPAEQGRLLIDPNALSEDGTVAIARFTPSPDGKLLAYATSDGGSDWSTWHFMEVDSGELLPDQVTRNKFAALDWIAEGEGVVYARFDAPTKGAELHERNSTNDVCLHILGTPESEDLVLVEAKDDGVWHWPAVTESGKSVVISHQNTATSHNEVEVLSLVGSSRGRGVRLISGFDAIYDFVGNDGQELWFHTDLDAPNGRIVAIDLFESDRERWRELIPEQDVALESATAIGGHLVLSYLNKAHTELRVHRADGSSLRTQGLPGIATVNGVQGTWEDQTAYFSYTSYSTPPEVWSMNVTTGESSVVQRPEMNFERDDFLTEQVTYASKDGTPVSMFLVRKHDTQIDGQLPTLLYGYGGFNVSLTPYFDPKYILWMERGGLLAVPNLRGGGEYGEAWHQAGTKLNKQNVFDDFIAAAEWLMDEGYSSPERLAISGGSNGGLLVGACLSQRPDLFAAALPDVGVMDMLRYQNFTIGWAWARDYGTSADPEEFNALYAYSPLHNLRDGERYPATLVMTGDHDDRVVPAHSYKFAARLQEATAGNAPALIRIETRAGHGAGRSTAMRIDKAVAELAFLQFALGLN